MKMSHMNDPELWQAIRNDDEAAFRILFDRYWVRLYNTAKMHLKDKQACEELIHDVFLNLWKRRDELEIQLIPNFLLTAVRYQVYNRMRAAKSRMVLLPDSSDLDGSLVMNEGDFNIREQEFNHTLNHYLDKLPNQCKRIFYMSKMDNLSNGEIANQLGISKRTVENQLSQALKHLRVCLRHNAMFFIFF
jgi:RNA polymerase sigma-70 factor (family 1)